MKATDLCDCPVCKKVGNPILIEKIRAYQIVCAICGTSGPRCATGRRAIEIWNELMIADEQPIRDRAEESWEKVKDHHGTTVLKRRKDDDETD